MTEIQWGHPVDVYWNLHQDLFSVRSRETGRVLGHFGQVWVEHADLVVQPAGNRRVRETGRKNVHAFVRGTLYDVNHVTFNGASDPSFEGTLPHHRITYNPHQNTTFVARVTGLPVTSASMVRMATVNRRPMLWASAHNYKETMA